MNPCNTCPDRAGCILRKAMIHHFGGDALDDSRCLLKPREHWTPEEHEINRR